MRLCFNFCNPVFNLFKPFLSVKTLRVVFSTVNPGRLAQVKNNWFTIKGKGFNLPKEQGEGKVLYELFDTADSAA